MSIVIIGVLLLCIVLQHRWHKQTLDREARRQELAKRISEFGERLTASAPDSVDVTIVDGLTSIVARLDADRLCWYEVSEDSAVLLHKYTGCVREAPSSPKSILPGKMPFMATRLGKHDAVMVRSLDDLPAEGHLDREFLQQLGVKSLLLIPSSYSPTRKGVLGLASYTRQENWPEQYISQLAIAANIIGATLERKYEQKAREESEERFRYLFAQASIGIALETLDGRMLEINPAFCAMLGYTREELKSLGCSGVSHPDDELTERVLFEELRQGLRSSYLIEKRFLRKDGSQIWGQVSVSLLSLNAGAAPLVVGMVTDCTAQKTAEASLRQRDRELQRLTGHLIEAQEEERRRISRELHDDIGQRVALLACELDMKEPSGGGSSKPGRDRFSNVRAQLDTIATDIHKLSHELHSASLQCSGLRMALMGLCAKYRSNHHLQIDLQVDQPELKLPNEVALCLFRVAQEALANALKHAHADRIVLRLSQDDEKVHLSVKDFGLGFDPTAQSGGIGLTTMRERLRLCGGRLSVTSSPQTGTEVLAEVPAPVRVAATAAAARA